MESDGFGSCLVLDAASAHISLECPKRSSLYCYCAKSSAGRDRLFLLRFLIWPVEACIALGGWSARVRSARRRRWSHLLQHFLPGLRHHARGGSPGTRKSAPSRHTDVRRAFVNPLQGIRQAARVPEHDHAGVCETFSL